MVFSMAAVTTFSLGNGAMMKFGYSGCTIGELFRIMTVDTICCQYATKWRVTVGAAFNMIMVATEMARCPECLWITK